MENSIIGRGGSAMSHNSKKYSLFQYYKAHVHGLNFIQETQNYGLIHILLINSPSLGNHLLDPSAS